MERHIHGDELFRLFSSEASSLEINYGVPHLAGCQECWNTASELVASLKHSKNLPRFADDRDAVVALMNSQEERIIRALRSKGWVAEMRHLSRRDQAEKITTVAATHTGEVFETLLSQARNLARKDPFGGEQLAMSAFLLVDSLSDTKYPPFVKRTLKLFSMTEVANSRRLGGNWHGSFEAISTANSLLTSDTMNSIARANLLSVHASLVCDTGSLEAATVQLQIAADIYLRAGDLRGLAKVGVQEADAVLAANKPDKALLRAREVLVFLPSESRYLQLLARNVVTESLVELGRTSEALRSYEASTPLFDEFGGEANLMKVEYLEARLLDALGYARESEKLFRSAIAGVTDLEIYRLTFIFKLALFASLFKRGAIGKAIRLCEEAIDLLKKTDRIHGQMSQVWKSLLTYARSSQLQESHIAQVRDYLVRHWTAPISEPPFAPTSGRGRLGDGTLP